MDDQGTVLPHDGKAAGNLEVQGPIAMRQYFKVRRVVTVAALEHGPARPWQLQGAPFIALGI